mmetsp:Transcript_26243/g.56281  ORF Transcript_26243/g.56281 Transcript_26243/m.56281 type:complete len:211 (+) Transcript_26243:135-767(+)|eukprot:CAMPEP_0201172108 /NCGR_PEP_ID=MMETSP0851-20130426/90630_1 /ASSEMBLY_ACC=CAM_ASM_000631 /TAXON_ID=183588 /ORGANISM="Pseudo-nitzschia fraudulenta, Strain WWA7" /LENGTH=210 /DNA_ID=CAMNT_0047454573 /DNA_START=203 /DNA_END=835 /DNA_ORIENTATION=-
MNYCDTSSNGNNVSVFSRHSTGAKTMSVRLRGESNKSRANARWNVVEDENDENDFATRTRMSSGACSIENSIVKHQGVVMGCNNVSSSNGDHNHQYHKSVETSSNSFALRRNSKYSYRLRRMLQTDLKMPPTTYTHVLTPTSSSTDRSTVSPSPSTSSSMQSTKSLHDEFSEDIENLLKSLQSTEFVGRIDPRYHSRYMSEESLAQVVPH